MPASGGSTVTEKWEANGKMWTGRREIEQHGSWRSHDDAVVVRLRNHISRLSLLLCSNVTFWLAQKENCICVLIDLPKKGYSVCSVWLAKKENSVFVCSVWLAQKKKQTGYSSIVWLAQKKTRYLCCSVRLACTKKKNYVCVLFDLHRKKTLYLCVLFDLHKLNSVFVCFKSYFRVCVSFFHDCTWFTLRYQFGHW